MDRVDWDTSSFKTDTDTPHKQSCALCRDEPFVCPRCGFRCDVPQHIHAPCETDAQRRVHAHVGCRSLEGL